MVEPKTASVLSGRASWLTDELSAVEREMTDDADEDGSPGSCTDVTMT